MRIACALLAAVALSACERRPATPFLDIATTTSVVNSGMLETLLPRFTAAIVRVHAAGSGRSLAMLAAGQVALVISHAPQAEAQFLQDHPDWQYRKLAFNRFVLVGPQDDPANVATASSAVDAFERLARTGAPFISRGDSSGTHERERELWMQAGISAPTVLTSGGGMATTLRQADQRGAYTLSDEATWWQLQPDLGLKVLFAGDVALLNTYAVIARPGNEDAQTFAAWLTGGEGRRLIAAYQIDGRTPFVVWPAGCPGSTPAASPCH